MKNIYILFALLFFFTFAKAQERVVVSFGDEAYWERGTWMTSQTGTGGVPVRITNIEGSVVKISPKLPKSGRWKVSMIGVPVSFNLPVVIYHHGKMEKTTYQMKSTYTPNSNYTIGSEEGYDFDAKGNEFVGFTTLATWTRISGVVFELVEEKELDKPTEYADSTYYETNETDYVEVSSTPGFKVTTSGWRLSSDPYGILPVEPYHVFSQSTNKEVAEWHPQITLTGEQSKVKIFIYTPVTPRDENPADVTYELICPSNASQNKKITYTKDDGNGWKYFGEFVFSGNADEYIQVVRPAGTPASRPTRVGCIKFEQWAPEQGGEVLLWQTSYINANDATKSVELPSVTLTDMGDSPVRFFIEAMCNKGLVEYDKTLNTFNPSSTISASDFINMLSYAVVKQTADDRILNSLDQLKIKYSNNSTPLKRYEALEILMNEFIPCLPQNKQWIDGTQSGFNKYTSEYLKYRNDEQINSLYQDGTRQGILNKFYYQTLEPYSELNKEYATMLIKGLFDVYFWSLPPIKYNWTLRYQEEFDDAEEFWSTWSSDDNSCPGHIYGGRFKENISVNDGKLKILVKYENPPRTCALGKPVDWSAGSVADPSFKQKYGYWEARYKLIDATSLNQSFWMNAGWGFEIDVNEGHYPNQVNTTLHYVDENGENKSNSNSTRVNEDMSKDYHTFACFWRPDSIFYYCDNVKIAQKASYNAQQEVYPILSLAILSWAGAIKQDMSGKTMDCEWVRIYTVNRNLTFLTNDLLNLQCNGDEVPVTVRLTDENGNPVIGEFVNFANEDLNDATFKIIGENKVKTDIEGKATIIIKGGRFEGKTRLVATVENEKPSYLNIETSAFDEKCAPEKLND